jgi:hypothetical protein
MQRLVIFDLVEIPAKRDFSIPNYDTFYMGIIIYGILRVYTAMPSAHYYSQRRTDFFGGIYDVPAIRHIK